MIKEAAVGYGKAAATSIDWQSIVHTESGLVVYGTAIWEDVVVDVTEESVEEQIEEVNVEKVLTEEEPVTEEQKNKIFYRYF